MPDGDVVHYRPNRTEYRTALEQLAEGQPPAEVAYTVMQGIVKDVRDYNDEPLILLETTCDLIETSRNGSTEFDHAACSERIDDQSLEILGHRRGMPLAADTCKEILYEANESSIGINQIVEAYIWRIYEANFAQRRPLYDLPQVSKAEMASRLQELKQSVAPYVEKIAQQVVGSHTVKKLKRLPREEPLAAYDSGSGKHDSYDLLSN